MEIQDFDFFIDREKNRPCLIAGNAPSIINFPFNKFRGIYMMQGHGPLLLKRFASPNYWVVANYESPVPQERIKLINSIRDYVFIFSDTAACFAKKAYDREFLKKNIKVPWFPFDLYHFNRKKCDPLRSCCKLVDLYPGRITIQEFMERYFGMEDMRHDTGTAVIFSLMFAVLMGCSPIYLHGIELPLYSKDYIYYSASLRQTAENFYIRAKAYAKKWLYGEVYSHFYYTMEPTLKYFERMADLCHRRGGEIYNLSPTSNLNRIKVLPYLDCNRICG